MGRVIGIARCDKRLAPLELVEAAEITPETGIAGDVRGTTPGRQVSILAREDWEAACAEIGAQLDWTTRRANILVEGLDLPQAAGARLRLGAAVLEIAEETEPCALMEKAQAGLRRALTPDWRGGVCCRVVEGGTVRLGDEVTVL